MTRTITLTAALLLLATGCGRQWYWADLKARLREDAPVSVDLKPVTYWFEYMGDVKMAEASDAMEFTLVNKLQQPITVEWDRCAFVDADGVSHRVIHAGVRLMNRDQPQAPSVVGALGRIEDLIIPTDYVAFVDGRWINRVYLPIDPAAKGKKYSFIVAILVDGKPQLITIPIELIGVGKKKM